MDSDDYKKPKRPCKFAEQNMKNIKKIVEAWLDAKNARPSEMEQYEVIASKECQTIKEHGERAERTEQARIASRERMQRLSRVASLRSDFMKEGMRISEAKKATIAMDNNLQWEIQ